MEKNIKSKLIPISLAVLVIIVDQITKLLIVKNIPYGSIGFQWLGDFLRIVHISNTGVAFSVGADWPTISRAILFCVVPLIVIIIVVIIYFKNKEFTTLQNWAIMGIAGGGLANLIDRFFRKEGVVDFIDVKFYGIFGYQRWPTFNIADSAVVVCGILLVISFIVIFVKDYKAKKTEKKDV